MNINNTSRQFNRIATCLSISFLMLIVFLALTPRVAEAALQIGSSWELSKGKPKCGGIVNGKLQAICENLPAKKESKAVGKCPKGSIFDLGTWSCFTKCPAGYNRTGYPVNKEKACSKNIKDVYTEATYLKKLQCPSGSKYYPLKNGECWSCPSGYGRTAAAVDKWNACGWIGKKAVSASFKGKACGEDGIADPRKGGECWSCPAGAHRTGEAITHKGRACVQTEEFTTSEKVASLSCPAGQDFDFIDGGTCWSCPTGYKRSLSGVKSKTACQSKKMVWQPPTPTMPGLFGINGAEAVLTELIKEQTQINTAIESTAKGAGGNPATWKQKEWKLIKNEPWKSSVLATAVLNRAAEVARKPAAERSQTEKDLLNSVSNQIQQHRLFVANQTKQAFDNALATDAKIIEQRNEGGMQALFGGIATAPDYNQLTQAALGAGGAATMAGGLAVVMGNPTANIALFPYRELARKAAIEASKKIATQVAKSAGSKALSSLSTFASVSAGPLIIITGAVLIAQMELDKILQTEETKGKIRQAIDQASKPLDLPVFLEQKDAMQIIMSHWGALMAGTTQPSKAFKDELKKIDVDALVLTDSSEATDSSDAISVPWNKISGAATDIAIGSIGDVWVVNTKGQVKYRDLKTNKWSASQKADAVKIAVGKNSDVWLLDKSNKIFRGGVNGWKKFKGTLIDIAAGSGGHVWGIGAKSVGAGGNEIYKLRGKKWQKQAGAAIQVAVTAKGNAWVVTAEGKIYSGTGKKWNLKPGLATEVAIGADGSVWRLSKDETDKNGNAVYRWNSKNKNWELMTGHVTSLAIAPSGMPWGTNKANNIYDGDKNRKLKPTLVYTCTNGYKRDILKKETASDACYKTAFKAATKNSKPTICPTGQEKQLVGNWENYCISCPAGFSRDLLHFEASTAGACFKVNKTSAVYKTVEIPGRWDSCPSGYKKDPNKSCFKCPTGYGRNLNPVGHAKACTKNNNILKATSASFSGKWGSCAKGYSKDLNGLCWKCPAGTKRDNLIGIKSGAKACVIPAAKDTEKVAATKHSSAGNGSCPTGKGKFQHLLPGDWFLHCASCPSGYVRNANAVAGAKACDKIVRTGTSKALN